MPTIENMTIDYRRRIGRTVDMKVFNLTNTVGMGGVNAASDVKVIQCIFATLMKHSGKTHLPIGTPDERIPAPDGRYTAATGQMILKYQEFYSIFLLSVDGKVSPASFKGRILRRGGGVRRMSIQMLNEHLGETSALVTGSWDGGVDLVLKSFPELENILTDKTLGSKPVMNVS